MIITCISSFLFLHFGFFISLPVLVLKYVFSLNLFLLFSLFLPSYMFYLLLFYPCLSSLVLLCFYLLPLGLPCFSSSFVAVSVTCTFPSQDDPLFEFAFNVIISCLLPVSAFLSSLLLLRPPASPCISHLHRSISSLFLSPSLLPLQTV